MFIQRKKAIIALTLAGVSLGVFWYIWEPPQELPYSVHVSSAQTATPSISIVTGTFTHNQPIVINGQRFGSKAQATPQAWDNTSTIGGAVGAIWDGSQPSLGNMPACASQYAMQYRPVGFRGVTGPHPQSTGLLAGAHHYEWNAPLCGVSPQGGTIANGNHGLTVMVWKDFSEASVERGYASWYEQQDRNFYTDPCTSNCSYEQDRNNKLWTWTRGGDGGWYFSYGSPGPKNPGSAHWVSANPGSGGGLCTGINGVNNPTIWSTGAWTPSPFGNWIHWEVEFQKSRQATGITRIWANGNLVTNYAGQTDCWDPATNPMRGMTLGGYHRDGATGDPSGGDNNWRYFTDLYVDTSWSRVMLCNQSTWSATHVTAQNQYLPLESKRCEIQPTTQWTQGSQGGNPDTIRFTLNQGGFTAGQTAYLYVVDSNGVANTQGYPILISGSASSSDTVPPLAPTGLQIQ